MLADSAQKKNVVDSKKQSRKWDIGMNSMIEGTRCPQHTQKGQRQVLVTIQFDSVITVSPRYGAESDSQEQMAGR